MKRLLLVAFLVMASVSALSDTGDDAARQYISRYSGMAVAEMYRSGVPASITLAQGLLESANGRSRLAVKANNHFGIKCASDWKGPSISADDDRKNECFRKYDNPEQSFADHSDFLRFKPRYASLFELKTDDYKSWAHGLKAAGYATDPSYAQKLIRLIEEYDLSRYDRQQSDSGVTIPEPPSELEKPQRYIGSSHRGTYAVSLQREVLQKNGIPFIYAREGETYRSISAQYDLFPGELARFNDSRQKDDLLDAGEIVYLQAKATRAAKGLDKYVCQEGDSIRYVAQKFGIKLKSLMKLNGINDAGRIFKEDDVLLLRPAGK